MQQELTQLLRLSAPELSAAAVAIAAERGFTKSMLEGSMFETAELWTRANAFWTIAAGTAGCQWDRRWV
jgi:hypothetical protein